jgi:hypothetical protein
MFFHSVSSGARATLMVIIASQGLCTFSANAEDDILAHPNMHFPCWVSCAAHVWKNRHLWQFMICILTQIISYMSHFSGRNSPNWRLKHLGYRDHLYLAQSFHNIPNLELINFGDQRQTVSCGYNASAGKEENKTLGKEFHKKKLPKGFPETHSYICMKRIRGFVENF